jgi:hypothetical protein
MRLPRSMIDLRLDVRMRRYRFYKACMGALDTPEQQALVDRLRRDVLSDREHAPVGTGVWDWARSRLVAHIRDDDPRRFLHWPEIRSTMFLTDSSYSPTELDALMNHLLWKRWQSVLTEDPCGCPVPSRLAFYTSDNLIHHAYHALTLDEQLGGLQDFDEIIELGGGFGSFVRLIRRLGITSDYCIYDFPEFLALQRYYLASVALHREEPGITQNVRYVSSIDECSSRNSARLFVAFWSLSEMPLSDREHWYDIIAKCSGIAIAFQPTFEGVDNKLWFDELCQRIGFVWDYHEIPYLPNNYYLIGRPHG